MIAKRWGGPRNPYFDDLCQAGRIGLMQAAKRFDPKKGVKFKSYATHRIIGEAKDFLRRQLGAGCRWSGIEPKFSSIYSLVDDGSGEPRLLFEDLEARDESVIHNLELFKTELVKFATRKVGPEKAKYFVHYYVERMTLRMIGEIYRVSEAWVCQVIHKISHEDILRLVDEVL
jgi:RNA polymerase sigma factor (sigma-70 family)